MNPLERVAAFYIAAVDTLDGFHHLDLSWMQAEVWDRSHRDDGTFSTADFTYDEERDVYTCPAAKILATEVVPGNRTGTGYTPSQFSRITHTHGDVLSHDCRRGMPLRGKSELKRAARTKWRTMCPRSLQSPTVYDIVHPDQARRFRPPRAWSPPVQGGLGQQMAEEIMKLPLRLLGGVGGVALAAALVLAPESPVTLSDAAAANPNPTGLRIASPHKKEKVSGMYTIRAVMRDTTGVATVRFCYTDFNNPCMVFHTDPDPADDWTAPWNTLLATPGDAGLTVDALDGNGNRIGRKYVIVTVAN